MVHTDRRTLLKLSLASGLTWSGAASAADFPTKPIKLFVPFSPGGAVDIIARELANIMTPVIGAPMVVENRGGAGGTLAVGAVAQAAPDGYTLLIGSTGPVAITPSVFKTVPFDPIKSFSPIVLIATTAYVMAVSPKLGVKNLSELLTMMRSKSQPFNFASAGTGGPDHLAAEEFKAMAKVEAQHIPFKGAGDALQEVAAGRVQFFFVSPLPTVPLVKSGVVLALAVSGSQRSSVLPDVPTVAEFLPGYNNTGWYGVFAPAGTPPDVAAKLNQEFNKAIATPRMQDKLISAGMKPEGGTPENFARLVASDVDRLGKLARQAKVSAD